jgi:hypothetical protein
MAAEPARDRAAGAVDLEVLVDGHVHFHDRFDETRFFHAARRNFERAAEALGVAPGWEGVLVLTESAGADHFARLMAREGSPDGGLWHVEATGERTSLRVQDPASGATLVVIAGRQIQTEEGLEVLAFPLRASIPDGAPIRTVLAEVAAAGALSQVPWGFGKWWRRRGRVVRDLLSESPDSPLLLADTGHRPSWTPRPRQLAEAERLRRATLTGSDPLPLAGEESRAGSCCFVVSLPASAEGPAERVRNALAALERSPTRHERRPGAVDFATKQVAMQIRKRGRG